MSQLLEREWCEISKIIFNINAATDDDFRMSFFRSLEELVPFDTASFFIGYNAENQKGFINPLAYKHPYDKISDPNVLFKEYEAIREADYYNSFAWRTNSTVVRDSDIINDSLREDAAVYKKIRIPLDMRYSCNTFIIYDGLLLGKFALLRKEETGDFTDKELFILEYLQPHVTLRMYQLHPQSNDQIRMKNMLFKDYGLTQRELEIVLLICKGYTNKKIGDILQITEDTIKKHIMHIYKKMHVNSRSKLITICMEKNYKLSIFNVPRQLMDRENPW